MGLARPAWRIAEGLSMARIVLYPVGASLMWLAGCTRAARSRSYAVTKPERLRGQEAPTAPAWHGDTWHLAGDGDFEKVVRSFHIPELSASKIADRMRYRNGGTVEPVDLTCHAILGRWYLFTNPGKGLLPLGRVVLGGGGWE